MVAVEMATTTATTCETTGGSSGVDDNGADRNVEIWKIKKLIKSLEMARGYVIVFKVLTILLIICSNGTSMISLIIPPRDQIARVAKMLADEFGTASNIKSRVNRLSVLGAITSVQGRLKLYNKGANYLVLLSTISVIV
jgi:peptide chain release factor subunit 1